MPAKESQNRQTVLARRLSAYFRLAKPELACVRRLTDSCLLARKRQHHFPTQSASLPRMILRASLPRASEPHF